ncbi:MAG TPA: hypothetical protein PLS08_07990 [Chryseolinea sp.]|nr:hypothetical protein [Chryseolinea sp.]
MKKLNHWIYAFILFLSVIAMGCGGSDSDTPEAQGDGIFTATVGTTAFTSSTSEAKAVHTKGFGGGDQYAFYVVGYDKTTKRMINFTVLSDVEHTSGVFSITLVSANQAYYYENKDAANEAVWISPDASNLDVDLSHGSVTLTEITSTRAKGTFNITTYKIGEPNREITDGSFDVPLKRQGF